MRSLIIPLVLCSFLISFTACKKDNESSKSDKYSGWGNYAGTKGGFRYSSLKEINLDNVKDLEIAWTFSSGDKDSLNRTQNQCNSIIIDGILYGSSPKSKLLALNAANGKPKWIFDPMELDENAKSDPYRFYRVNRGITYWEDENKQNKRLFYNAGGKVYAISANNGRPIMDFGEGGYIDLSKDLGKEIGRSHSYITNTSPGIIYKDLLILGSSVKESADAAPGDIRAYDVMTGERKWVFNTIPHPGEPGYETWPDKQAYKKLGGANSWAGMSLDEELGIVYIPTGSVSGDFYGGIREGKNLYANSLVALDAGTGKYLWHFQIVHHDLWDRDLAANPNLVTLYKDGDSIDAVAQITKHGYIFLFDRKTGEPVFPIEEKSVPQDALPGEKPWPSQPIPKLPEPFARQYFSENEVTDLDKETHEKMLKKYRQIKNKEMFHPPSKEGNWIFPGFDGGGEWGGAAVDPETQIMYVNSSELPWSMFMVEKPDDSFAKRSKITGKDIYTKYCIACHGNDLKGNGVSYPSLVNLADKYKPEDIKNILKSGINMMPSFEQISEKEMDVLIKYLLKSDDEKSFISGEARSGYDEQSDIIDKIPYRMTGYNRFLDDNGYPGIKPPWGTLNAINLNTGKLVWKVPLGEYPELTKKGHSKTGTENYGGPVVTKGGLVFIAATKDSKIRAFNKDTGEEVWEAELPVPGYATPSVYSVNGKQYLVVACGGGKIGSASGDSYVAFSLKD